MLPLFPEMFPIPIPDDEVKVQNYKFVKPFSLPPTRRRKQLAVQLSTFYTTRLRTWCMTRAPLDQVCASNLLQIQGRRSSSLANFITHFVVRTREVDIESFLHPVKIKLSQ